MTINISVVIPSFFPAVIYGGPIFSSLHACEELSKLGHSVHVSTTNTNMYSRLKVKANSWTKLHGFYVKYYNETIVDKLSLALLYGIKEDIKSVDVVHVQAIFNTPTIAALYFSKKYQKPVLLSPRGVLGDWVMGNGNPFKKLWLRLFIKPYASLIHWHATSEQERQEVLSHFPNAQVHIIPNGIEFPIENNIGANPYEQFLKEKIDGPIIFSMGRIHAKKGFDILIESFSQFIQDFPTAHLFIAGEDEGEQEKLENLIAKLDLKKNIHLVGFLNKEQKNTFLTHADIFALPSHNENFGNVYLESLACGTPIVASKNSPWEMVEEYNCGLWVDNTSDEFYNAMKQIISNPQRYTKENCIQLSQRYSWRSVGEMFARTFEQIIVLAKKHK